MKTYKFTFLLVLALAFNSCSIEEEPPFLSNQSVYSSATNATAALNGIYKSMAEYGYYSNSFVMLTVLNSGFAVTHRGNNTNTAPDNATVASLRPESGNNHLSFAWSAIYQSIGRCNDAISSATVYDNPGSTDEQVINDVIGQAYFVRAFNYFNLVRLWGEVPLRTAPTTPETVNLAKSPTKEIYAQIIADAKKAQQLMNGAVANGTPKPEAATMLLAKVYMTLATAPSDDQEAGVNYWQLAYDEAIQIYGAYSLLPSYDDLFLGTNGNNTEESIFELQSSEDVSLDHTRAFTPWYYTNAFTFDWLKINAEVYDLHANTYPGDSRLTTTYISTWTDQQNGNIVDRYPTNPIRSSFDNAFPSLFKLGSKDPGNSSRQTNKNFKIYRYADLLLMLAEISNELQNGKEMTYVSEVLSRVGLTPRPEYLGGQESFRKAIMEEYQFELLGETHEWFNNRRRGYNYFLNNVIIPHNTAPTFDPTVDVTESTDEATVMHLPIPNSEINGNDEISD